MKNVDELVYELIRINKLSSDEETVNNIRYGITLEEPTIVNWLYLKYVQHYNAGMIALFENIDNWRTIATTITAATKRILSARLFEIKNRDLKIIHLRDIIKTYINIEDTDDNGYIPYVINALRKSEKLKKYLSTLKDDEILNSIIAIENDNHIKILLMEHVIGYTFSDISNILYGSESRCYVSGTISEAVKAQLAFINYRIEKFNELQTAINKIVINIRR